jgi:hypothetical protein
MVALFALLVHAFGATTHEKGVLHGETDGVVRSGEVEHFFYGHEHGGGEWMQSAAHSEAAHEAASCPQCLATSSAKSAVSASENAVTLAIGEGSLVPTGPPSGGVAPLVRSHPPRGPPVPFLA